MIRVAVVGDSAIWGQGLAQDEKYVFKYVKWLNDQGIQASLSPQDFVAHSGAIIGDESELNASELLTVNEASSVTHFKKYYPEVPTSYPTILRQLEDISDPDKVDMLIMNGGVNDIGITGVATFDDDAFIEFLQKLQKIIKQKIPKLFKKANNLFPHAKIIYTGYYPALSDKSRLPLEYVPSLIGLVWALEGDDLQKQAMQFNALLLSEVSFQIARFNSNYKRQITFCPSGFGAKNAAYAEDNFVFELGENRDQNVDKGRVYYCELVRDKTAGEDGEEWTLGGGRLNDPIIEPEKDINQVKCSLAYVSHPNQAGANKYVEQLQKFTKHVTHPCSTRKIFKSISATTLSYRGSLAKFSNPNINSLKQLINMQCINVISVSLDVRFSNMLTTTDDPYPEELDFDFGWGKVPINISYQLGPGVWSVIRIGAYDAKGDIQMKRLTQVKMFLKFRGKFKFRIDLKVFVNGYEIVNRRLSQNSFSPSGESIMLQQWRR